MRKIIILLPMLLIIGCYPRFKEGFLKEEAFYKEFDKGWRTKQYNIPVDKCFDSFSTYLIDSEMGIEKTDKERGKLVTARWNNASGSRRTVNVFDDSKATATREDHYAKYYIEISGDDKICNVKIVRVRLWVNAKELQKAYGVTLHSHVRGVQEGFGNHLAYADF